MTEPLANDSTPTFFVLRALRRYWRTIALTVVVIVALAGAYELTASRTYTSSATVLVRPLVGNAFSTDTATNNQNSNVALQTEARIAASSAVSTLVDKALPASTSCDSAAITTRVLTNTQLIDVSFAGSSAANAKTCAEKYAEQYLSYRSDLAVSTLQGQLVKLNDQVNSATVGLIDATKAAKQNPSDTSAAAKVQQLTTRLSALQTTAGQLEAQTTNSGNVVVHAARPAKANGISPALIVLAAAIGALVLGALIAIWRGRSDRRIHAVTDGQILGLPVLNSALSSNDASHPSGIPDGGADEEFRLTAIGVLARATAHSTIAVAPVTVDESSAAVTIRLARAIAASGYSVILVDATTRGPQVGTMLGIEPQLGLSDILGGADSEEIMLVETGGVEVLTAGTDPAANRERYSGALLREFLGELKQAVDFVLVSASPVGTADGLGVLLSADQWIVVARTESTTYESVAETASLARRLDADILGVVFAHGPTVSRRDAKPGDGPSKSTPPARPASTRSAPPEAAPTRGRTGEKAGTGTDAGANAEAKRGAAGDSAAASGRDSSATGRAGASASSRGGTGRKPSRSTRATSAAVTERPPTEGPPTERLTTERAAADGAATDRPATDAGRPRRGTS